MEIQQLEDPLEDWLSQFPLSTQEKYRGRFQRFCEWAKTNAKELVKEFKKSEDKLEWSKNMGKILVRFQSELLDHGLKDNTVRNIVTGVRSFFSEECIPVKIRKGRMVKAQSAKNEHVFTQSDLQKMYHVADLRDKAILSTGVALGWGVGDFLRLKREFIENQIKWAKKNNENFVRFDWSREKTKVEGVGILTPESINDLDNWLNYTKNWKSQWLWCQPNGKRIHEDTLNDVLKRLVDKSGITVRGSVRFHLLRKFLMNTLGRNGLNEYETKIIIGKKIPITDSTYLQTLKDDAFEKYKKNHENFNLTGVVNNKVPKMEKIITELREKIKALTQRIQKIEQQINQS